LERKVKDYFVISLELEVIRNYAIKTLDDPWVITPPSAGSPILLADVPVTKTLDDPDPVVAECGTQESPGLKLWGEMGDPEIAHNIPSENTFDWGGVSIVDVASHR